MRRILIIAALSIAACTQQDLQPAPANEAASMPEASAGETAVPALEGRWQVTALDGKPIASASAMTASFGGGKVSISSGCLRRAWTFTQKRNVVAFKSDPTGSANCGGSSPSSDQETAYAALDGANIAIFGKDGSEASLSGTGGNLTLQRR